ncbi:hypothetical protein DFJ73DRAFT_810823 [Zopfochytrium polystomum]|nr:hypothetical protein DFJ73DRAFT_810823 [Zopfochytrium polystomum]
MLLSKPIGLALAIIAFVVMSETTGARADCTVRQWECCCHGMNCQFTASGCTRNGFTCSGGCAPRAPMPDAVGPKAASKKKFKGRVKLDRRNIEQVEGTGLVISAVMDSECKECFGMANSVMINDARAIFTDLTLVDAAGLKNVTVADDGTIEADVADKMALVDSLTRRGFTMYA